MIVARETSELLFHENTENRTAKELKKDSCKGPFSEFPACTQQQVARPNGVAARRRAQPVEERVGVLRLVEQIGRRSPKLPSLADLPAYRGIDQHDEASILREIKEYYRLWSEYGQERSAACQLYLEQLKMLLLPTQVGREGAKWGV